MGELIKQCAWCFPSGSPGHNPHASHGLCDECLKKNYPELYAQKMREQSALHGQEAHV